MLYLLINGKKRIKALEKSIKRYSDIKKVRVKSQGKKKYVYLSRSGRYEYLSKDLQQVLKELIERRKEAKARLKKVKKGIKKKIGDHFIVDLDEETKGLFCVSELISFEKLTGGMRKC